MRYKIIVNPVSGRGNGMQSVPQIEQQLKIIGLQFDLECSLQPWHAADLACQASLSGFDAVVAVGGDGTVNEVINGLMRARALEGNVSALGVLCVGRGNDFAFGAGIFKPVAKRWLKPAEVLWISVKSQVGIIRTGAISETV